VVPIAKQPEQLPWVHLHLEGGMFYNTDCATFDNALPMFEKYIHKNRRHNIRWCISNIKFVIAHPQNIFVFNSNAPYTATSNTLAFKEKLLNDIDCAMLHYSPPIFEDS
jgi:hypothetical protein